MPALKKHIATSCSLFLGVCGMAQDLGQLGQGPAVQWSGGLSAYTGFYATDRTDPRQVPFTWGLSGRVNFSIYQLQIPFSFVLSEKERDFRQPFNQYGLSPKYKWFKAHLGHRSMHFSELTMSGQRFFGAGVELDPGKFRFAAMYGKLRKEVFADTTDGTYVEPSFDRRAMAARIGFGTRRDHLDLILFQAKDAFDVGELKEGYYGTVQPKENLVVGIDAGMQLAKGLQLQVDAAISLLNEGDVPGSRTGDGVEVANNFDTFLFNLDPRSRRGTAIKSGLSYNLRGMVISAKYDRISPLFETLGNYYFLSDVANYRGSVAFGAFKQKLRTMLSMGIQHNDLAKVNSYRTKRTIGSASMQYNSGKTYSAMLSYSNFEADMRSVFSAAETDTIHLTQVSHNATLNQSLRFRDVDKKSTRSVSATISFQQYVNEGQGTEAQKTSTYTGSIGYRHRLKERNTTLGARATYTHFELAVAQRNKYGLSLNGRKGFFNDKMGVSGRFAFYFNRSDQTAPSVSLIASAGVDRKIGTDHTLGLSLNYNTRKVSTTQDLGQYQVRGQLTYSLTLRPKKKGMTTKTTGK